MVEVNGVANIILGDRSTAVVETFEHPRCSKASKTSLKDKRTIYETDTYKQTETTFLRNGDSFTEKGSPITTHTTKKTSSEGTLDSEETLCGNRKTLLEDNNASLNKATPFLNTPQFSTQDSNSEDVIDKIIAHRTTPKKTLYQVYPYEYKANNDTDEAESNIPAHFVTPSWRSTVSKPSNKSSRRGRRLFN